jgi:hypothetical protein
MSVHMALRKGQRNKGTFKPGNKMNPKGRGASIPILKLFRESTTAQIAEIYRELMTYTEPQLNALCQDDSTPILHKNIAQVLLRDNKNKEMDYSERVLNRIIGPVPARQEVSGANGMALVPPQINIIEALPVPNAENAAPQP